MYTPTKGQYVYIQYNTIYTIQYNMYIYKRDQRDFRLKDLKELLLAREYPQGLVDRAIAKAIKIPRKVALLKIRRTNEDQKHPVFVIKYDPRMPPKCKVFKQNMGGQW